MNNELNSMKTNFGMGFTIQSILEENADLLKINPTNTENKEKDEADLWSGLDAQAAFLGPNIWGSPADPDFKLEQLDLTDFLGENDLLPASLSTPAVSPAPPVSPPPADGLVAPLAPASPASPVPAASLVPAASPVPAPAPSPTPAPAQQQQKQRTAAQGKPSGRRERSNRSRVPVKFRVSPSDLALATAPGVQFDPQTRQFSDDELKPQPMCKKSKKQVVPDDAKDQKYWTRRERNNFAAKRSRDARRLKENQIVLRANFLEKENSALRDSIEEITRENERLKERLSSCTCD